MVHSGLKASIPTEQDETMTSHTRQPRQPGPVETLCREIGYPWDRRLEREDLFVAFVGSLVAEVADRRRMAESIAHLTGKSPAPDGEKVLNLAFSMVAPDLGLSTPARIDLARAVHDLSHEINPDDPGHSCDHEVDMLASCASAIRFGLEQPCRSRHAAEAASHVWQHVYGVSRFDSQTPSWQKEWTRGKLTEALISLLPPTGTGAAPAMGTEQ